MLILSIRTDNPQSELGLYKNDKQIAYIKWEAHRKLAETIHIKLKDLLQEGGVQLNDLDGLVIYKGPGSFTGLRIGMSVANALSVSFAIPIVADSGGKWQNQAISRLVNGENEGITTPDYGNTPYTSAPQRPH